VLGMISLGDALSGARFCRRLPAFLRHPIGLPEARAILRQRLERRAADFLGLVRHAVYEDPESPYRRLLHRAGCQYGDLEQLVSREGVEEALRALLHAGVYLTHEELKGRRPVVRGALTLAVDPSRLRNRRVVGDLPLRSGGHQGSPTAMTVDLAFMRETNVNHACALDARGGIPWRHAVWDVPGGAAIIKLLRLAGIGAPPARWFSQIDPAASGLHPRYRWSARALWWGGRLAGVPLPRAVHIPLDDPRPIARWMAETLRDGETPHLVTHASAAVRLCLAARSAGVEIRGAQATIAGEPVTDARMAEIRRSGVHAVAAYGSSDTGTAVAYGCSSPSAADDLHLFHDLAAVIQPGGVGPRVGLPAEALLLTSLRATAPLVLLNVALGDQAVVEERPCGCPLWELGWTTHLHTVRSFEKLTAGGMNFLDVDLIRVLDEVLPARFGGGPTHYQLVEEETAEGHPRLRLLVDPAIGPLDGAAVAEAFLTAIGGGSGAERVMGLLWHGGGFVTVERRAPSSARGDKIQHLRRAPARADPAARG